MVNYATHTTQNDSRGISELNGGILNTNNPKHHSLEHLGVGQKIEIYTKLEQN